MPTNRAAAALIFDDCQLAIEADLKTKVARTTADKRNKAVWPYVSQHSSKPIVALNLR